MEIANTSLLGIIYSYFAPYDGQVLRMFRWRRLLLYFVVPVLLGLFITFTFGMPSPPTCLLILFVLIVTDALLLVALTLLHMISITIKFPSHLDEETRPGYRNTRFRLFNYQDIHISIIWILILHIATLIACLFFLLLPPSEHAYNVHYIHDLDYTHKTVSTTYFVFSLLFTIIIHGSIIATLLTFIDIARRLFGILHGSFAETTQHLQKLD